MRIRSSFVSQTALLAAAVLVTGSVTAASRADAQTVANVSVSPATSNCEQPVTLTVTLTEPARPLGLVVSLSSSVPSAAPLAPSLLISGGATSSTARFRCVPGKGVTTVTIGAGAGAVRKSATLTVLAALTDGAVRSVDGTNNTIMFGEIPTRTGGTPTPIAGNVGSTTPPPPSTNGTSNTITEVNSTPTLDSISLTSSEVIGGFSVAALLKATAGATGVTVSVFPNRAQAVTLPTTVIFAKGETSKRIVINTRPQLEPLIVEIIAADSRTPDRRKIAKFTIRPPRVRSIALASTTVVAGQSVTGTMTLDGVAPDGFTVRLTSSSALAPATSPIAVQAGATLVHFTVPTVAGSAGATVTLTATAHGDTTGQVTTFRITP